MALTKISSHVMGSGAVTAASLSGITTDNVSEGSSNTYFTNARARGAVSVTGGNLSYDSSSGVIQLTTDTIRGAISAGTGVSISAGAISIGQSVATSATPTFGNITTTGYIAGPSTFTIDPAAVGDNTGTVVIAGNLQVDGTTTTINSTTLTVDDKLVTLASGSANAGAANGAGIEVDISGATNPSILYDGTDDEFDFNKPITIENSSSKLFELDRSGTGNVYDLTISDAGTGAAQLFFNAQTDDTGFLFRPKDATGGNVNALLIAPDGQLLINMTGSDVGASTNIVEASGNFRIQGGNRSIKFNNGSHEVVGLAQIANQKMQYASGRMTIDFGNSRVGIGTATYGVSPTHPLHVHMDVSNDTIDETKGLVKFQSTGGNGMIFGTIASSPYSSYIQSGYVVDTSAANYAISLNPLGGKVGIGTTNPGSFLEIFNNSATGNTQLHIHNDKSGDAAVLRLEAKRSSNNDTGQIIFANNGSICSNIRNYSGGDSGELRFYTSTSGTGNSVSEAIRLTNNGNLQFINTTTSIIDKGFSLHTNGYLYLRGGSSGLILADDSNHNTIQIIDGSNGYINFETSNGTSKMRLDASGKLGIGTGSSAITPQRLELKGHTQNDTMSAANAFFVAQANGGDGIAIGTRLTTPYATWIQSAYIPNLGTSNHYALSLNPHGGDVGVNVAVPTHSFHAYSTDTGAFLFDRNSGNEPASINEFSTYYSLSIKNRASGSYLNFGGGTNYSSLQGTDGAGSATAKHIILNPYGGRVGIGTSSPTGLFDVNGVYNIKGNPIIDSDGTSHYLKTNASGNMYFYRGSTILMYYTGTALVPGSDNSKDLGSSALRWRNVYTTDLHLSNEGKEEGNEVDGTTGNWTIQEGEEHLYIINNKSGKKYKFALEEIE